MDAPLKQRALRATAIGLALITMFTFFFVYPGHNPEPNGLPVASDEPLEVEGIEVTNIETAEEGRQMILDREVYAAFAEGRILVSSAASFTVAQRFSLFDPTKEVEDVKPLDRDDPRGASLNLLILPLMITGILSAMILATLAPDLDLRGRLALSALLCFLGGLIAMVLARLGIGVLPGSFLALTGIATLILLAANLPSGGVIRILGPPGVGAAFILFLMLGVPSSGSATAPELLPTPWAELGQFLQAGAGTAALRNTAYFDGAAVALPLIVLIAWAAVGVALHTVAERRTTSTS